MIVRVHDHDEENVLESKSHYNAADLIRANTSNKEYIAISHHVTHASQVNFVLGDTKPSECCVSVGFAKRRKREVSSVMFVGRNPKLQQNQTYSIFIVTASPTRAGYAVKASESVQVTKLVGTNQNEQSGQSQTLTLFHNFFPEKNDWTKWRNHNMQE